MGCVESRQDVNDMHATIFQVESVDGNGVRHRSGRLEVTDTTLVFHSKNKAPIRWPLRCLRRYGFDGEKFHFESGRRCTTGPGIYSYRCRRAEELFNMLQLKIKRIAELSNPDYLNPIVVSPNNRPRANSFVVPHPNHSLAEDLPTGTAVAAIQIGENSTFGVNSPIASPHTPISPPNGSLYMNNTVLANGNLNDMERSGSIIPPMATLEDIRPELTNSVIVNHNNKSVSYINYNERSASHVSCHSERLHSISPLNSSIDGRHLSLGGSVDFHGIGDHLVLNDGYISESSCPIYMNVGAENRRDLDRLYAKTALDMRDMPVAPPRLSVTTGSGGSGSSYSGTGSQTPQPDISTINYITVDIDKGSDSSQVPPFSPIGSLNSGQPESPPTRPLSERYATIDFERTEALTSTAKIANRENANGRHNSTFSGSVLFPLQNLPYSE